MCDLTYPGVASDNVPIVDSCMDIEKADKGLADKPSAAENADTFAPSSAGSTIGSFSSAGSTGAPDPDDCDRLFEEFLKENEPDIIAEVNPEIMLGQDGETVNISLSEGVKNAIANYDAATGKVLTPEEISKTKEGLVFWATQGMKLGSKDPGGFHQRFQRAVNWNDAARGIWEGLPDCEREAFKSNWATFGSFEFATTKKLHINEFQKGTRTIGKMMSIYAIARELGGWEIQKCRMGAFRYAAMCMKVAPHLLVSDRNWSGLRMFKWVDHLSWQMSAQYWKTEVESMTTEQNTEWKIKSDTNKATIAFAAHHNMKVFVFPILFLLLLLVCSRCLNTF